MLACMPHVPMHTSANITSNSNLHRIHIWDNKAEFSLHLFHFGVKYTIDPNHPHAPCFLVLKKQGGGPTKNACIPVVHLLRVQTTSVANLGLPCFQWYKHRGESLSLKQDIWETNGNSIRMTFVGSLAPLCMKYHVTWQKRVVRFLTASHQLGKLWVWRSCLEQLEP